MATKTRVLIASTPHVDSTGRAGTLHVYSNGEHVFVPGGGKVTPWNEANLAGSANTKPAPTATPAATGGGDAAAPPVSPFLTPDDLLGINAFQQGQDDTRAGITRGLADLTTDTAAQTAAADKTAIQNTDSAQQNAAARGIFQSSIKDANVYDIEAQRRINEQLLNDHLTTARLDAQSRLGKLDERRRDFNTAMAGKQVQNAQAVTPTVTAGTSAPSASDAAAKAADRAATVGPHGAVVSSIPNYRSPSGVVGTMNIHADGTRVFVR